MKNRKRSRFQLRFLFELQSTVRLLFVFLRLLRFFFTGVVSLGHLILH
jgi:hypothetical protein